MPEDSQDPRAVDDADLAHLRRAIAVAAQARERGDHPFGAVVVDGGGAVLVEAANVVDTERDATAHAELVAVRRVSGTHGREAMRTATLYASTEPCAMCAAAAYWAGVGRVVFAFPASGVEELRGPGEPGLQMPARAVLRPDLVDPVVVVGPVLAEEGRAVHVGFW